MGLFKSLRNFFSGTKYRIDRDILKAYMEESIALAKENDLSFCDEFYLSENENDGKRLHITIINYDASKEDCLEEEEWMKGIVIFVNEKKCYYPETDQRYYLPEDFIDTRLYNYPQQFVLYNELAAPTSLEQYII